MSNRPPHVAHLSLTFEVIGSYNNESDKIERLLSRTLPRTVRVSFKTYGSNRPLSVTIRGRKVSFLKISRFTFI